VKGSVGSKRKPSRGREGTGLVSYATVGAAADPLSLAALRVRGLRYWFAGIGLLALAIPYTSALAALRQPSYVPPTKPLPMIGVPAVAFPLLRVPKLHAAPKAVAEHAQHAAAAPAAAAQPVKHVRKVVRRRLPVVADTHSTQPGAKQAPAKPADPFLKVPVVEDDIGTMPALQAAPAPAADASAAPTTDLADTQVVDAAQSPDPVVPARTANTPLQTFSVRKLEIASDDPAPVVSTTTVGTTDTPTIDATVPDPVVTATVTSDTTTTTVGSDSTGASGGTPGAATIPLPSGPTTVSATTGSNDSTTGSSPDNGSVAGTTTTSGGTQPPPTTASGTSTTSSSASGTTTTIPEGATPPPPDPASMPGSGPSPPGSGLVTASAGGTVTSADGSASVSFAPGTVDSDITVSVTPVAQGYDLTAVDSTGARVDTFPGAPVLTIHYDPAGPAPSSIFYIDPANGPVAISSTVDTTAHTISAALPHFSTYATGDAVTVALAPTLTTVDTPGTTSTTLNVTVTEQSDSSPAVTATVTFATDFGALSGSTCVTNASGQCSVDLTSSAAGMAHVTATVTDATGTKSDAATITFRSALSVTGH
jgi:hypothetical protein